MKKTDERELELAIFKGQIKSKRAFLRNLCSVKYLQLFIFTQHSIVFISTWRNLNILPSKIIFELSIIFKEEMNSMGKLFIVRLFPMSETPLQDEEKHTFGIVAACEKRRESDMLRSSETLVNVLSVRSVKFWTAFTWIYLFRLFPAQAWKTEVQKKNSQEWV